MGNRNPDFPIECTLALHITASLEQSERNAGPTLLVVGIGHPVVSHNDALFSESLDVLLPLEFDHVLGIIPRAPLFLFAVERGPGVHTEEAARYGACGVNSFKPFTQFKTYTLLTFLKRNV